MRLRLRRAALLGKLWRLHLRNFQGLAALEILWFAASCVGALIPVGVRLAGDLARSGSKSVNASFQ